MYIHIFNCKASIKICSKIVERRENSIPWKNCAADSEEVV